MRKTSESLSVLLDKEREKLDKLLEKRKSVEAMIKVTKDNIARYEQMANAKRFDNLADALDAQGISVEDIFAAIRNGDFLSLQEKMEAERASGDESTHGAQGENNT